MVAFYLLAAFILVYTAFGLWLVLHATGLWRRKSDAASRPINPPYANIR
jgi:hypothetical protein